MASKKQNIIFAGGGTGWHVTPILSLHDFLKEEGEFNFFWLGERDSLEYTTAIKHGIEFRNIAAGKIRRYFDMRNFYEPLKNLTGFFESIYYILKFKWNIIFSKWGFVALPVCLAGFVLRKKIYIHESDTVMGLTNKICSTFASKIFYSFPNEKIDGKKHIHSGPIVNPELLDGLTNMKVPENETLSVLVIAGSQGSTKIFKNLLTILPDCSDIDFTIILGTHNTDFTPKFEKFSNVKTYNFIEQRELGKIMKNSDIAITRWSSTLWELYYFGIHSIIVPLKATWGDHQTHNAQYFHTNFWSDILDEDENLSLELFKKLQKYKSLRKANLNLNGFLDGIKNISEDIQKK